MKSAPALIEPEVLRWARESAGYSIDEASSKIAVRAEKLAAVEHGELQLTLRQAERAARVYRRSLAMLFLPEPPAEEPVETQFRRLPGSPQPPWPSEMRLLARTVTERQEAAVTIYEELDEQPPWIDFSLPFSDVADTLADEARTALGITLDQQRSWRDPTGYRPLTAWREAAELVGVLVMQDGSLPVEQLRGFAAVHPLVPAIVLNSKDDPRARAFTLVHELGHLLRARADHANADADEAWCDQFAGVLLMPAEPFSSDFSALRRSEPTLLNAVDALSRSYGVTPAAGLVRISRLHLLAQPELDRVRGDIERRSASAPRSTGGGDYYRNTLARLGPAFTRLVLAGLDEAAVTSAGAAGLLGTRIDHFPKLIERLADPVEAA